MEAVPDRIPSRGFRFAPHVLWMVVAGFAAVGAFLIIGSGQALNAGTLSIVEGVSGILVLMLGVALGLGEYFSNRWIEIGPAGVTAVYWLHRRTAPWHFLTPMNSTLGRQAGFLFDRGEGRRTQLWVTFEQMRAILSSPYSPRWTLGPNLAKRLGASSEGQHTTPS
jgi:hypothetical protein